MKKRIIVTVLLILSTLLLVSCHMLVPIEKNPYVSTNAYEEKIINTSSHISKSNIEIIASNTENGITSQLSGNGVVIAKTKGFKETLYIAVTLDTYIGNVGTKVIINGKDVAIKSYAKNSRYGLGVISFITTYDYEVAEYEDSNNNYYDFIIGQTVVTSGTSFTKENRNAIRKGVITHDRHVNNNTSGEVFVHDAAINYGEMGSGVYNIDGKLIGLNKEKTYEDYTEEGIMHVLGHTEAYSFSNFINAIESLDFNNLGNSTIDDTLFDYIYDDNNYTLSNEETSVNNVYKNNIKYVVSIFADTSTFNGIIINKRASTNTPNTYIYQVLTVKIEALYIQVKTKDSTYTNASIINSYDSFSIIEFETTNSLEVYNSSILGKDKKVEHLKGQTLVSLKNTKYNSSLSVGSLSKPNYSDNIFMSDIRNNFESLGVPVFNLNNELVGLYSGKVNSMLTNDGQMAAEGLSFILDINAIDLELNNNTNEREVIKYVGANEHEKSVIEVGRLSDLTTVTITSGTGHGSGVIINKGTYDKDNFIYYILTNHHVIADASEVNIVFNDEEKTTIVAKDYNSSMSHDMGIVRFISNKEFMVAKSIFTDDKLPTTPLIGQTLISVGTPDTTSKNGYLTTGVVSMDPRIYRYSSETLPIFNLGILQDSAINPGNSGGPAFDLNGVLIGINASKAVSIVTPEGNKVSERTGYSLSAAILEKEFESYTETTYKPLVRTPKLGVTIQEIPNIGTNPEFSNYFTPFDNGYTAVDFDKTRKALEVLEIGDILYEVEGARIKNLTDVSMVLANAKFGDKIKFTVLRVNEDNVIEVIHLEIELS